MAYLFNGATHVIRRADAVLQTWPLTMHARVRLPSVDALEHCLFALHEATVNNGFRMVLSFTGGTMKARMGTKAGGSNANATTTTSVSDTNWHSVVGQVTGASARQVWLDNGGNASNGTSLTPGVLTKTLIGATEDSGVLSTNVNHEVAHVALWAGTLTTEERQALADGIPPIKIRPDILRFYWPGGPGTVDVLGDAMTVTGATEVDQPRSPLPRRRVGTAPVPTAGAPASYTLTAAAGSYALTGGTAGTLATRLLTAASGSYTLTGGAATLAGGKTLVAANGSYTLTGGTSGLLAGRQLTAASGSYALTGGSAAFLRGLFLDAAAGSYALSGSDAGLAFARTMAAEFGSYALTGADVALIVGIVPPTFVRDIEPPLVSISVDAEPGAGAFTRASEPPAIELEA